MMSFIFSLLCVYLAWWMFSHQFRTLLYSEWVVKPFTTWEHLNGVVVHILKLVSPQNAIAQGFVDFELKILSQRRSFMLLSFQRLAVLLAGLMLLCSLHIETFIAVSVIGTILLVVFYKNPVRWVQVAFLCGVFFASYQWSFYQSSRWIFSESNSLSYILADGRIGTVLIILGVSVIATIFLRIEFWSLWLSSLLFFSGGLATLNLIAIVLGEAIGWGLFWFILSSGSSKKNQVIFRELLLITIASALIFLSSMAYFKSIGLLEVRLMGPLVDKKILFLTVWSLWEFFLTCLLSVWGHFRSQNVIGDTTDLESIRLPISTFGKGLFAYNGWLYEQLQFRQAEVGRRLNSLEGFRDAALPEALMKKSRLEVESLKRLLGALK